MRSTLRIYSFFPSAEILAEASFVFLSSPAHYLPAGREFSSQSINHSHQLYRSAALWARRKRSISMLPAAPRSCGALSLSTKQLRDVIYGLTADFAACGSSAAFGPRFRVALSSRGPLLPQKRCDTDSVRCQVIPGGVAVSTDPSSFPGGLKKTGQYLYLRLCLPSSLLLMRGRVVWGALMYIKVSLK